MEKLRVGYIQNVFSNGIGAAENNICTLNNFKLRDCRWIRILGQKAVVVGEGRCISIHIQLHVNVNIKWHMDSFCSCRLEKSGRQIK